MKSLTRNVFGGIKISDVPREISYSNFSAFQHSRYPNQISAARHSETTSWHFPKTDESTCNEAHEMIPPASGPIMRPVARADRICPFWFLTHFMASAANGVLQYPMVQEHAVF